MRENDLILGSFADVHLPILTGREIDQYEALLEHTDTEIFPWLTGKQQPPAELNEMIMKIIAFRQSLQF